MKIDVTCAWCGVVFAREESEVKRVVGRGHEHKCSQRCVGASRRAKRAVPGERRVDASGRLTLKKTHGLSQTTEYHSWRAMIDRCTNHRDRDFQHYGGRGIRVCERWLASVEAFVTDMGPRPTGYQLDRRDNDGHYEPGNCRWATVSENQRNRRNNALFEYAGERRTAGAWAEVTGLPEEVLRWRLRHWPIERALSEPISAMKSRAGRSQRLKAA